MTELSANPQSTPVPDFTFPVVIIGAGPAGLAAAQHCAMHDIACLLLDEQDGKGGQIYRNITRSSSEHQAILGTEYQAGLELAQSATHELVDYRPGCIVWQITRDKTVSFTHDGRTQTVQADRIILATGAMERPFPIPGWTLPGVLSCGGAQVLLKESGVVPEGNIVVVGCGPLLYLLVSQYLRAGVKVSAIVDTTGNADIRKALPLVFKGLQAREYLFQGLSMLRDIKKAGIPHYKSCTDLHIEGKQIVTNVAFNSRGKEHRLEADVVLLHQGVIPNTQITVSLRAEHKWDQRQLCWRPVTTAYGELNVNGIFVAGDGAGIGGAKVAEQQGALAAVEVCHQLGALSKSQRDQLANPIAKNIRRHLSIRPFIDTVYQPQQENRVPTGNTIVCRCEAVTADQIITYVDHGCTGPNQAKAFGRCGMGPCQGRECGTTVTELIANRLGKDAQVIGHYRIRPPIKPITLAELAGED